MQGLEFLQIQIIDYVYKSSMTKAMVIGFMAKSPNKTPNPPAWMMDDAFDDGAWLSMPVNERKYFMRVAIDQLLTQGRLRNEDYTTSLGQVQRRIKAGSVLDRLATIYSIEEQT